ncbi:MAG: hypothetical protein ACJ786_05160, partial [Catenulispora sp.]
MTSTASPRLRPGTFLFAFFPVVVAGTFWLPASGEAFVWLARYRHGLGSDVTWQTGESLWRTLRRPYRALTYPAARAVLMRANAGLGTNWTLHDLRHSAARRMTRDPDLLLTDV